MINVSKEKCTGCQVCSEICPRSAIEMEFKEGFRYPKVNTDKCVDCNLCEKICPAVNKTVNLNQNSPTVYAAWSNNKQTRETCTSGGICYELSKYIINIGGYVAGVVWSDNYRNAEYILTNSAADLDRLMQTKYFQPKMNGIYKKIKEKLNAGCKVLFIGSACSNDALKRFLSKDYENLYCVDYICRGYTSQMFHEKRIQYLETKHRSKVSFVQYKNKSMGWTKFGILFKFQNGEEEYINRTDDAYELMFKVEDNNTRPSCYNCKYRSLPRHTDITVGDFWGIKEVTPEDLKLGVSVVIASSPRGEKLISEISDAVTFEKRSMDEVYNGNKALLDQLPESTNGKLFFEDLDRLPYQKIVKKYASKNILRSKKAMSILKSVLKCNVFMFLYYNFLCRRVTRKRFKFVFPCIGSRIQLDKGAKLIINDNLFMNLPKHKYSREECYLKVLNGGCFEVNGVCKLAANNTIEINNDATLKVGSISSNYGTVIICGNRIEIGNDVGFGRNVVIYDNNFHSTGLNKKVRLKPLIIEDHVWICSGVTIVKGIRIERGAVCSINSTVTRNVKSRNMVAGNPAKVVMTNVDW